MEPYRVIHSRRTTMSLEIAEDLQVLVRAPIGTPGIAVRRFIDRNSGWIATHRDRLRAWQEAHPEPTPEQRDECIRRARELLPGRIEYFGALMGLRPSAVTVTGARRRFGSCSARDRLCFSWRLMLYPEEAVDYVVVHELAHIRHKNHGREFYRLIASILPDYRERIALLRA